jgi:sulfatase modifying factor 1
MLKLLTGSRNLGRVLLATSPAPTTLKRSLLILLLLSLASFSQANLAGVDSDLLEFEWLPVGNPGNAADITGFGAVAETFQIAKYEATNAQYATFLNAKAAIDPLSLYSASMGAGAGGITRSGIPGSFTYNAIAGREQRPVNWLSYYDTLRFANWMHNGQGDADTETGAYTLEGGTAIPTNGDTVQRNPDSRVFIPTEDEWYKSTYHNANGLAETDYFEFPFRTSEEPTCTPPPGGANHANCARAVTDVVPKGSYPESIGPYGTLDQGGNVWEWNVGLVAPSVVVMRGGGYYIGPNTLGSSWRDQWAGAGEFSFAGFRLAASVDVDNPTSLAALLVTNYSAATGSASPSDTNVVAMDFGLDLPLEAASVDIDGFSGSFTPAHSLRPDEIQAISLYRDTGNGVFDQRNDSLIARDGAEMSITQDSKGNVIGWSVDLGSAITVTDVGEQFFMVVDFDDSLESTVVKTSWSSSAHASAKPIGSASYSSLAVLFLALLLAARHSEKTPNYIRRLLITLFAAAALTACGGKSPQVSGAIFAMTVEIIDLANQPDNIGDLPISGTVITVR